MTMYRLLLVLSLILLLVGQTRGSSWWGRRRRGRSSSCSRVNCVWRDWSGWRACNHPCGTAGTQSRSRGIATGASCGGSSCSGPSSQTRACNRYCDNGGTPQSGHCDCPDEFWGTCCDKPCAQIDHCSHRVCSNGINQQCRTCNYEYGGNKTAYRKASRNGYSNRICEKICSWRSDSTFCYPGKCPGIGTQQGRSCQCASGFGSTNCLTISAKPKITNCLVTAETTTSSSTEKVEIGCEKQSNTVNYTSFLPDTVKDGSNGVSYQTSRVVNITWSVTDPESHVSHCEWAAGKSPGSQEVQTFTRATSLSAASMTLDTSVSHGETIYSMVRCFNYAGLQSTLVSSGIVIVTEPPDVSMATVKIITSSVSHYPSRSSHQSDKKHLFFGWEGVRDRSGIAGYQVSLQQPNSATILPWKSMANANQLFAELRDLGLESYKTYTLMLRATNHAHLTSDVITCNFTVETEAPRVTHASLQSHWPQRWILNLDWTGMFTSNSSLLYEINIGMTPGGIDILSWMETELTTLRITGVDYTKEHHVTLTTVNKAGLYLTRTYPVTYSPLAGSV